MDQLSASLLPRAFTVSAFQNNESQARRAGILVAHEFEKYTQLR